MSAVPHDPLPSRFEVGEVVLIADGPLTNFEATIEELSCDGETARVWVLPFGGRYPFWIACSSLRKQVDSEPQ